MSVINQLTVILPGAQPIVVDLGSYGRNYVTLGRGTMHGNGQLANDIQIDNAYSEVSRAQCTFTIDPYGYWSIADDNSTNGLFFNGQQISSKRMVDGDRYYIGSDPDKRFVLLFATREAVSSESGSSSEVLNNVKGISLQDKPQITIGRIPECDIVINHPTVSRQHCIVRHEGDQFVIYDTSSNGVLLNSVPVQKKAVLNPMDRITIAGTTFIFTDGTLYSYNPTGGVSVSAENVCKVVGKRGKKKTITDNVSFTIEPNKFVAIIGGSGAGKTTILDCISGMTDHTSGEIFINGEPLSTSGKSLRSLMGYVPQQDIVYDSLTLEKMLFYSAKLKMSPDSSKEEIKKKIDEILDMVELTDHRKTIISKLSGGQRKRASIAVELLASPRLFFLDEPSSGLDPGTEKHLMLLLKKLAASGKTVIMVTHTVQNLDLCDDIVCMGRGGKLCFFGPPADALKFFEKPALTDIYDDLNQNSEATSERYKQYSLSQKHDEIAPSEEKPPKKGGMKESFRQFRIMTSRYFAIILSKKPRLILLLLLPVFLTLLVCVAFQADGNFYNFLMRTFGSSVAIVRENYPFLVAGDTMSLMFAFSCAAFWTGIFNSVQEVSKERTIFERERFSGISVSAYVMSKFVPLCLLCIIQSAIMYVLLSIMTNTTATMDGIVRSVTALSFGMDTDGVVLGAGMMWLENYLTTFLCTLSAMCLGLMISTLVSNEMALILCPICLMPQILFSGVAGTLTGITKTISNFISCRWSCLAFFISADINELYKSCEYDQGLWELTSFADDGGAGIMDAAYESTTRYLFGCNGVVSAWIVLSLMCLVFVIAAIISLRFKKSRSR